MIKKLTEANSAQVESLLIRKPIENLFILGCLKAYRYQHSDQVGWGDFDQDGQLRAVLWRAHTRFIPFSVGAYDAKGFAEIINAEQNRTMLFGLESVVAPIAPYLKRLTNRFDHLYFSRCTRLGDLTTAKTDQINKLTPSEIERLAVLLDQIPEFQGSSARIDAKRSDLERGLSRCYYIKQNNQMVATASTALENDHSAMISAVGTHPNFTGQGLATVCLAQLVCDVLSEGKSLYLFYDNPIAGKLYDKLGFQHVGRWLMYQ
ncbi:GNAT family N-acetyltransferase [Amphibacillus cookii]|uniref:GNAT family N-acetyltransferase n=1 Tax=Amphibacillus cookii TaxID=767787 RepID=UPI0019567202|nr:GNAT family N-acetyltransferase [Amphibacillus cookii]MBM7541314.1 putative GNAT family acetyltransferase [Amphibacillus cookii]